MICRPGIVAITVNVHFVVHHQKKFSTSVDSLELRE